MTPLIPALLVAVVALCKAGQDAMWHGWRRSVFARFSDRTGYWGDASAVWLRRYVDQDSSKGLVPVLRCPVMRQVLVPFWDGWHLLALTRSLATTALPAAAGAPLWTWPALFTLHSLAFEGAYRAAR